MTKPPRIRRRWAYYEGDRIRVITDEEASAIERELAAAQAGASAVRELMNVHNLGGWTDAVAPMKRALAAEARIAELERDAARIKQAALNHVHPWLRDELAAAIDAAMANERPAPAPESDAPR